MDRLCPSQGPQGCGDSQGTTDERMKQPTIGQNLQETVVTRAGISQSVALTATWLRNRAVNNRQKATLFGVLNSSEKLTPSQFSLIL